MKACIYGKVKYFRFNRNEKKDFLKTIILKEIDINFLKSQIRNFVEYIDMKNYITPEGQVFVVFSQGGGLLFHSLLDFIEFKNCKFKNPIYVKDMLHGSVEQFIHSAKNVNAEYLQKLNINIIKCGEKGLDVILINLSKALNRRLRHLSKTDMRDLSFIIIEEEFSCILACVGETIKFKIPDWNWAVLKLQDGQKIPGLHNKRTNKILNLYEYIDTILTETVIEEKRRINLINQLPPIIFDSNTI